ncbi:MAG: hypothetical protein LBI18_07690 [Planctomycetaceae bacterium]|jgi:hypothetical protein|nr:hypothetical protein [Planctomycetaceae bacterium]
MSSANNNANSIPNNNNIFRVSLLGAEGTGKSCFLAGLAFLGFDPLQASFKIYPQNTETARYLNSLDRAFQNGLFPPPTSITSLLNFHLQLPHNRTVMNILTVDYPGEDFRRAINEMTPEHAAQFSNHLLESDIIILLIDITDISNRNEEKQVVIREKLRAHLNAAYEVARQYEKTPKLRNNKFDICIGITKCDLSPFSQRIIHSSNGGGRVLRKFVNNYWHHFEKALREGTNIKNVRYFGLSAVGITNAETGEPVKGKIKPFGYEPMFRWIAERPTRISGRKFKQGCFRFLSIVIVLLVVIALGFYGQTRINQVYEEQQVTILKDNEIPVTKRLEQTQFPVTNKIADQRHLLLDAQLEELEKRINQTNDEQRLDEIREELKQFDPSSVNERKTEIEKLKTKIEHKLIEMELKRVRDYFQARHVLFSETAEQFLDRYPASTEAEEIREWKKQYENDKIKTERNQIGQINVANKNSLQEKSRLIFRFLEKYEKQLAPIEASNMKRAADLAKQFTEHHHYEVTINQYGGFAYDEKQNVAVYINQDKVGSHYSNANIKTAFPGATFSVTWQSGDTIRLELQGYGVYDYETAASYTNSSPVALRCLNQKMRLSPKKGTWDWSLPKRMSSDGYFIKCTIKNIADEDWQAFENYILPGNHW